MGQWIIRNHRVLKQKTGRAGNQAQVLTNFTLFYLFVLQYLGSTSVTRTHGTGSTDDAVRTIVQDVSQLNLIMQSCIRYSTCIPQDWERVTLYVHW